MKYRLKNMSVHGAATNGLTELMVRMEIFRVSVPSVSAQLGLMVKQKKQQNQKVL
jgi:hypothetical protein